MMRIILILVFPVVHVCKTFSLSISLKDFEQLVGNEEKLCEKLQFLLVTVDAATIMVV